MGRASEWALGLVVGLSALRSISEVGPRVLAFWLLRWRRWRKKNKGYVLPQKFVEDVAIQIRQVGVLGRLQRAEEKVFPFSESAGRFLCH